MIPQHRVEEAMLSGAGCITPADGPDLYLEQASQPIWRVEALTPKAVRWLENELHRDMAQYVQSDGTISAEGATILISMAQRDGLRLELVENSAKHAPRA